MERIVFVALVVSLACCELNLDKLWTTWKAEFDKEYNSASEEAYRRAVWEQNYLEVKKHNEEYELGWHTYSMATNHLSDMTAEEVKAKMTGLRVDESPKEDPDKILTFLNNSRVPASVNWVKKGVVTPVQNQGACGSCWAFSAVGALEAQMKMKTGNLVRLSEQNLVDCSKNGNYGCNGGYMTKAFEYIINNKGIDSESFYPYEERDGPCRYSQRGIAGYCSGFRTIPQLNETALLHAVANIGPVSVGIHASLSSFAHYRRGIYNDNMCNPRLVDHAVLVVGYGTQKKNDYWLIKNSWGTGWGEKGYMRMARNRKQCGIPSLAAVPIV